MKMFGISKFTKRAMSVLIPILILLLAFTWYYGRPFVKRLGHHGFVMVYNVENRSDVEAKFVIITKIGNRLIVEVIEDIDEENVFKLEGVEAKHFLDELELEYDE